MNKTLLNNYRKADSPRIYLTVSKPREVRKVVMKAFWRNVALWRRLVVPRLVITPRLVLISINGILCQKYKYEINLFPSSLFSCNSLWNKDLIFNINCLVSALMSVCDFPETVLCKIFIRKHIFPFYTNAYIFLKCCLRTLNPIYSLLCIKRCGLDDRPQINE